MDSAWWMKLKSSLCTEQSMNPAIRTVRVMQVAFIVSVLLFMYVLRAVHPATHSVNPSVQWGIVFCAIASAMMGFIVQRIMLRAPSQSSATTQDSTLLGPWFAGHVLRFATAESVALFGFALRMIGDSSPVVTALFAGSLLLLILWQPGEVPPAAESQNLLR